MSSVVVMLWIFMILSLTLTGLSFCFSEGLKLVLETDSLRMFSSLESLGSVSVGGWGSSFILVVLSALGVIIGFTLNYLSMDKNVSGFQILLLMFVVGMVGLLSFNSSYGVLIGWEVLGVTSFLLIMHYCSRVSSGSSMMTILMNRWGDVGLVLFIMWWGVSGVFVSEVSFGWGLSSFMTGLLLLCVISKSAQYPMSGWLPMAMAAPTPVSALVHSSTLVVAGLVVLCMLLWLISSGWLGVLLLLGVVTLLSSGVSALYEFDSKKVVALSTLFHLGVMVLMGCSVGLVLVLFHMILHAFYKSLCFIMVGWVIMVSSHEQDLRSMLMGGGLSGLVGVVLLSVVMNLVGLIYYSGWASKDILMELGLTSSMSVLMLFITVLGFGCSLGYSLNLFQLNKKVVSCQGVVSWDWEGGFISVLFLILYTIFGVVLGVYVLSLGGFYLSVYVSSVFSKCLYVVVSVVLLVVSSFWKSSAGSSMLYLQDMHQVVVVQFSVVVKSILDRVELVLDSVISSSVCCMCVISEGVVDLVVSWDLVFSIITMMFVMMLVVY